MKLTDILDVLNEAGDVVRLITSFKRIFNYWKDSDNRATQQLAGVWFDQTVPIDPFGPNWGRGALGNDNVAIVSDFKQKHQGLKAQLEKGTQLTFYWGYVAQSKTLYLELASIRGNGFNKNNLGIICSAIADKMKFNWKVGQNIIWESKNKKEVIILE